MSKKYKIVKKLISMLLVLSICTNSFAAIVSENDGSAFVTKSEFESLKRGFNSQISQYNSSIDNKIDGAISSYLAGIKLVTTQSLDNMIADASANSADNVKFIRWATPQATTSGPDVEAGFHIMGGWGFMADNEAQTNRTWGYIGCSNTYAWTGSLGYQQYSGNVTSAYYFAKFPFGTQDDTNYRTTGNTSDWTIADLYRRRLHFKLRAEKYIIQAQSSNTAIDTYSAPSGTITCNFKTGATANLPGSKNGPTVSFGGPSFTPTISISHRYTITNSSDNTNNAFLRYNLAGDVSSETIHCIDFNYRNNYDTNVTRSLNIQRTAASSTLHDGNSAGAAISMNRADGYGIGSTPYRSVKGNEYFNNITFNWQYNQQKVYSLAWSRLTSAYYNDIMQTPYYKYYGIPVTRTANKPGKIKLKLTFSNSNSAQKFTYQITDTPFPNGNMSSVPADRTLYREEVSARASYTKTLELSKNTIYDTEDGDYIYIKVVPYAVGQIVTVGVPETITYTFND